MLKDYETVAMLAQKWAALRTLIEIRMHAAPRNQKYSIAHDPLTPTIDAMVEHFKSALDTFPERWESGTVQCEKCAGTGRVEPKKTRRKRPVKAIGE